MKVTLKEVFESGSWIITKIIQGSGQHRVDAKRRFPIADKSSFFSEWGSAKYLERLSSENYSKKLSEFNCYQY
jgi:hypothetical protein